MRVALITIPRSGSSFYSRVLAKQYKVKHVGELFVVNNNPSRELLGKRFKHPKTIDESLRIWSHGDCCAKIFTRDFIHMPKARETLEFYENLVYGTADKIYYLYRRNTLDHLKSMITADTMSYWAPYEDYKEVNVNTTEQEIRDQLRRIEIDTQRLDDLQNRFPGETVYYEDFASDKWKYKYTSKFFCNGEELPDNLGLDI